MTPQPLAVALLTPRAELERGVAERATLPMDEGQITVLPNHATYLGTLGLGLVEFVDGTGVRRYFVAEGFVEVQAGRVVVLAERAQRVEDIDLPRAEQTLAAAQARLKQLPGPAHPDYAGQWARQERAKARIAAARTLLAA